MSGNAGIDDKIKVLIADDSAVIRNFLRRFIEEDAALVVAGTADNGRHALDMVQAEHYDVMILDIEMPVMDGLTALPLIVKANPAIQVIVASTLTLRGAEVTMKCLRAGAAECLAKPTSDQLGAADMFKRDLVEKIKALGRVAQCKNRARVSVSEAQGLQKPVSGLVTSSPSSVARAISLRSEIVPVAPDVLAIGSSTGGPQALLAFFSAFKRPFRQPVFLTQHMPPTFTTILAEHITKTSGIICKEGIAGAPVEGGCIYVAPGNYHMTVRAENGRNVIALNQDPPENFCRPAVDPMLRSLCEVYGRKTLAVILTGMGADGLKGCTGVVDAGGVVMAQDEPSSVVWGMPGAVAMAGVCTAVLPLDVLARTVARRLGADG